MSSPPEPNGTAIAIANTDRREVTRECRTPSSEEQPPPFPDLPLEIFELIFVQLDFYSRESGPRRRNVLFH